MSVVFLILVIGLIWYFGFYKKKQTPPVISGINEEEAEPVVQEALHVIDDFLNVGSAAQLLTSTDFRGNIIFVPDARPPFGSRINYGIAIVLSDLDDLTECARKYPKLLLNNPDVAQSYNLFITKYQNCYDPSKQEYVYETKMTVSLLKGQAPQLTGILRSRIERECPLADFSGSLLYTKNVAR